MRCCDANLLYFSCDHDVLQLSWRSYHYIHRSEHLHELTDERNTKVRFMSPSSSDSVNLLMIRQTRPWYPTRSRPPRRCDEPALLRTSRAARRSEESIRGGAEEDLHTSCCVRRSDRVHRIIRKYHRYLLLSFCAKLINKCAIQIERRRVRAGELLAAHSG